MNAQVKHEGDFSYIEAGEGHPLVLLHGLFGGLSNFDSILEHFRHRCRVIIPQLPIYTLPVLNTNVSALAKFLHRFLQHKQIEQPTLLGNSLGGHIALVFTSKYPTLPGRLVLTGSSGLYENAFGGSTPRKGDKEYLRKKIEVTFYDPKHATDELVEECYQIVNDRSKLIRILSLAKSAIRHNMASDLPDMKLPTCLIWGRNDSVTPPDVAEEFNRLMPKSELFWIEKCGHAPMMEHPEEFNRLLEAWMEKEGLLHA